MQDLFKQFQGILYALFTELSCCGGLLAFCLCYVLKEDKKLGWCPPSNESGQIFVQAREWMRRDKDTLVPLTYDEDEKILKLINKYISHDVGNHLFTKWKSSQEFAWQGHSI